MQWAADMKMLKEDPNFPIEKGFYHTIRDDLFIREAQNLQESKDAFEGVSRLASSSLATSIKMVERKASRLGRRKTGTTAKPAESFHRISIFGATGIRAAALS